MSMACTEFISASYLCRATFMTNRIRGGKTVAEAIWLLASKLLFIVSFHFFSVVSSRGKMTEEMSQLSQYEPGSHLC